jgi:hypothetical protein
VRTDVCGLTNSSGRCSFPDRRPGIYAEANTSPQADFTMQSGEVNQGMVVSGKPAVLGTERPDTGRQVDSTSMEELSPGVIRSFHGQAAFALMGYTGSLSQGRWFGQIGVLQVNGARRKRCVCDRFLNGAPVCFASEDISLSRISR